jgi:hypothetical protein
MHMMSNEAENCTHTLYHRAERWGRKKKVTLFFGGLPDNHIRATLVSFWTGSISQDTNHRWGDCETVISKTGWGHFLTVSKQPTKTRSLCHPQNTNSGKMNSCCFFTNDSISNMQTSSPHKRQDWVPNPSLASLSFLITANGSSGNPLPETSPKPHNPCRDLTKHGP